MKSQSLKRVSRLSGISAVLALLSCYGTLAVTVALSLLGITLVVNPQIWAGAIIVFSALTALGLGVGYSLHRRPWPLMLSAIGAGLIIWVMLGRYDRISEALAFAALVTAVVWDGRLRKSCLRA